MPMGSVGLSIGDPLEAADTNLIKFKIYSIINHNIKVGLDK